MPPALAEGEPQVYRIKRSGESAAPKPQAMRPATSPQVRAPSQASIQPSASQAPIGSQTGALPVPRNLIPAGTHLPRETAKYYHWKHSNRRTLKRNKRVVTPANYLDHGVLDDILRKFVNKHGWVNYRGIKRDKRATAALKAYVEDLSALDPSTLEDPSDRLAAWLNLYNALVLQELLEHYPVKTVLEVRDFFGKRSFTVGGDPMSLIEIEQKIFGKEIREPRAVLARVNGSSSGPRLMSEAYSAVHLEEQLEKQVWRFLMDRNNVDFNPKTSILILNPTFLWFREEFGDMMLFLKTYLDKIPTVSQISFRGYDWELNDEKLH